MGSSRFAAIALLRIVFLGLTLGLLALLAANTTWYATMIVIAGAAVIQWFGLLGFVNTSNREIGRFLTAIEYEDLTQTFSDRGLGGTFRELGRGLNRVMERLRTTRAEREEQAHYLRAIVGHIPVALLSIEPDGKLTLLNNAARRLLGGGRFERAEDLAKRGREFAETLGVIGPGKTAIVRLERGTGTVQLKAAATAVLTGGIARRLISLQSIESEMNAQELAAWQALIRVLTHEMMNSLTPVSSLSATAHQLVADLQSSLPSGTPAAATAADARDAMEAVARRSEGLLHFVQSYRRLTKDMVPHREQVSIVRLFARLGRLMGPDLDQRGIDLQTEIVPETLEIDADPELLDQALINLVRNATDALKGRPHPSIRLVARLEEGGVISLAVADNGPGIDPAIRDKIYVPFFTTKRGGSGVGLSLTRQIALVHGATVLVTDTPGGGATITLRFGSEALPPFSRPDPPIYGP